MPFNGSGVYTPPAADFPVVTNTVISSTHFNNTINDIATGLTTCLTKDGQTTPTANIKLGGFKLTGLGAPTATNDALSEGNAIGATTPSTLRGTSLTLTTAVSKIIPGATSLSLRNTADSADNLLVTDAGAVTVRTTLTATTSVVTPIVDSGTTGALSLKTNNGTTGFQIVDTASGVNFWQAQSGATTTAARLLTGGETNVTGQISSKGTGSLQFFTDAFANQQFEILRVSAANRWVTVAGSNGGNPAISTSAGNLAITPAVVMASTLTVSGASIAIGTNPAGINGSVLIPNGSTKGITGRNAANSGDIPTLFNASVNSVDNVTFVGDSNGGGTGVILLARSGAGAPTTSDLVAGKWMLWRDTAGATTKLYYNNAGALQSVALA